MVNEVIFRKYGNGRVVTIVVNICLDKGQVIQTTVVTVLIRGSNRCREFGSKVVNVIFPSSAGYTGPCFCKYCSVTSISRVSVRKKRYQVYRKFIMRCVLHFYERRVRFIAYKYP